MAKMQLITLLLIYGVSTAISPLFAYDINQTLSDQAQRTTIAFDGLAFLTGDLCADSFLPPGKIADFFGFQYLRDNDPDDMGHNTDFLSRIANNVFFNLDPGQLDQLVSLAQTQVELINNYAYLRFPLMQAFHRQLEGDIPVGSSGLDLGSVKQHSAQLYLVDGLISFQRAQVIGGIIQSLSPSQLSYLDSLAATGMLSWPVVGEQLDPLDYTHDVHVAVMTYASQLFSWYAGSVDADVYFCPERQGTYFGSFYLKDIPAMGNPGYSIDPNLTANSGNAFLAALTTDQYDLVNSLVDLQREALLAIVETREDVSLLLRGFLTGDAVDEAALMALMQHYGELDGEIVFLYATGFAEVEGTLSSQQMDELMVIRDLDGFPCSGAYLYSDIIEMPDIDNTDFLFGVLLKDGFESGDTSLWSVTTR